MRFLSLAYIVDVEGPTDWPLLAPIVRRLVDHLLIQASTIVETSTFLELKPIDRSNEAITQLVVNKANEFDVVFLHGDGKGQPRRAHELRILPIAERLRHTASHARLVGIVPVHETEAWALADGDALKSSLGTSLSDDELDLPSGVAAVESYEDPKAILHEICRRARGGRRHRSRNAHSTNTDR